MSKAIKCCSQELRKLWIFNDVEQTANKQTFAQTTSWPHFTIITTGPSSNERSYHELGICAEMHGSFYRVQHHFTGHQVNPEHRLF